MPTSHNLHQHMTDRTFALGAATGGGMLRETISFRRLSPRRCESGVKLPAPLDNEETVGRTIGDALAIGILLLGVGGPGFFSCQVRTEKTLHDKNNRKETDGTGRIIPTHMHKHTDTQTHARTLRLHTEIASYKYQLGSSTQYSHHRSIVWFFF